ncbi:MAG TPA: zinc ribbon domain-containing protein [Bryobacteraceae bacterium]|nr:zinc ribbon domain-containing protein [Bryobacteraceae bacterium]
MPIFEYLCEECGRMFEKLVLRPGSEPVACPVCGASRLTQQVSTFLSPVPGKHKPAPRQHSEYPDGLTAPHRD